MSAINLLLSEALLQAGGLLAFMALIFYFLLSFASSRAEAPAPKTPSPKKREISFKKFGTPAFLRNVAASIRDSIRKSTMRRSTLRNVTYADGGKMSHIPIAQKLAAAADVPAEHHASDRDKRAMNRDVVRARDEREQQAMDAAAQLDALGQYHAREDKERRPSAESHIPAPSAPAVSAPAVASVLSDTATPAVTAPVIVTAAATGIPLRTQRASRPLGTAAPRPSAPQAATDRPAAPVDAVAPAPPVASAAPLATPPAITPLTAVDAAASAAPVEAARAAPAVNAERSMIPRASSSAASVVAAARPTDITATSTARAVDITATSTARAGVDTTTAPADMGTASVTADSAAMARADPSPLSAQDTNNNTVNVANQPPATPTADTTPCVALPAALSPVAAEPNTRPGPQRDTWDAIMMTASVPAAPVSLFDDLPPMMDVVAPVGDLAPLTDLAPLADLDPLTAPAHSMPTPPDFSALLAPFTFPAQPAAAAQPPIATTGLMWPVAGAATSAPAVVPAVSAAAFSFEPASVSSLCTTTSTIAPPPSPPVRVTLHENSIFTPDGRAATASFLDASPARGVPAVALPAVAFDDLDAVPQPPQSCAESAVAQSAAEREHATRARALESLKAAREPSSVVHATSVMPCAKPEPATAEACIDVLAAVGQPSAAQPCAPSDMPDTQSASTVAASTGEPTGAAAGPAPAVDAATAYTSVPAPSVVETASTPTVPAPSASGHAANESAVRVSGIPVSARAGVAQPGPAAAPSPSAAAPSPSAAPAASTSGPATPVEAGRPAKGGKGKNKKKTPPRNDRGYSGAPGTMIPTAAGKKKGAAHMSKKEHKAASRDYCDPSDDDDNGTDASSAPRDGDGEADAVSVVTAPTASAPANAPTQQSGDNALPHVCTSATQSDSLASLDMADVPATDVATPTNTAHTDNTASGDVTSNTASGDATTANTVSGDVATAHVGGEVDGAASVVAASVVAAVPADTATAVVAIDTAVVTGIVTVKTDASVDDAATLVADVPVSQSVSMSLLDERSVAADATEVAELTPVADADAICDVAVVDGRGNDVVDVGVAGVGDGGDSVEDVGLPGVDDAAAQCLALTDIGEVDDCVGGLNDQFLDDGGDGDLWVQSPAPCSSLGASAAGSVRSHDSPFRLAGSAATAHSPASPSDSPRNPVGLMAFVAGRSQRRQRTREFSMHMEYEASRTIADDVVDVVPPMLSTRVTYGSETPMGTETPLREGGVSLADDLGLDSRVTVFGEARSPRDGAVQLAAQAEMSHAIELLDSNSPMESAARTVMQTMQVEVVKAQCAGSLHSASKLCSMSRALASRPASHTASPRTDKENAAECGNASTPGSSGIVGCNLRPRSSPLNGAIFG